MLLNQASKILFIKSSSQRVLKRVIPILKSRPRKSPDSPALFPLSHFFSSSRSSLLLVLLFFSPLLSSSLLFSSSLLPLFLFPLFWEKDFFLVSLFLFFSFFFRKEESEAGGGVAGAERLRLRLEERQRMGVRDERGMDVGI